MIKESGHTGIIAEALNCCQILCFVLFCLKTQLRCYGHKKSRVLLRSTDVFRYLQIHKS